MRKGLFDLPAERPAVTTNNTEPVKPEYPAVRTPAKGPIITMHDDFPVDLGVDNHAEPDEGEKIVPHKKAGRPKKA
jgi:hypothetical protein